MDSSVLILAEQLRPHLMKLARSGLTVTYSELMPKYDLSNEKAEDRNTIGKALAFVDDGCVEEGKPMLCAIVVKKFERHPSDGFFDLAVDLERMKPKEDRLKFYIRELQEVFAYPW